MHSGSRRVRVQEHLGSLLAHRYASSLACSRRDPHGGVNPFLLRRIRQRPLPSAEASLSRLSPTSFALYSAELQSSIFTSLRAEYEARPRPVQLATPSTDSPQSSTSSPASSTDPRPELHQSRSSSLPAPPPKPTRPLPAELLQLEQALNVFASTLPSHYRGVSNPVVGGIPAWKE